MVSGAFHVPGSGDEEPRTLSFNPRLSDGKRAVYQPALWQKSAGGFGETPELHKGECYEEVIVLWQALLWLGTNQAFAHLTGRKTKKVPLFAAYLFLGLLNSAGVTAHSRRRHRCFVFHLFLFVVIVAFWALVEASGGNDSRQDATYSESFQRLVFLQSAVAFFILS